VMEDEPQVGDDPLKMSAFGIRAYRAGVMLYELGGKTAGILTNPRASAEQKEHAGKVLAGLAAREIQGMELFKVEEEAE
jgi:hypothetical protein